MLVSDKPLQETITLLYHSFLESLTTTRIVVCDIVLASEKRSDFAHITHLDWKKNGVALVMPDGSHYAVVLPDTEGIPDTTALFTYLKHK